MCDPNRLPAKPPQRREHTRTHADNEEALEVVAREPDAGSAAQALVAAAKERWLRLDPSYIDDITVVCAKLTRER